MFSMANASVDEEQKNKLSRRTIHLVTGATGFIGRHLVPRLHDAGDEVWVLLRGRKEHTVTERVREVFPALASSGSFRAVTGDITKEQLGLSQEILAHLSGRRVCVWHLAADLSFSPLERESVFRTNTEATGHVVTFANRFAQSYIHMSTAYVCGSHRGKFPESDPDVGQYFHNSYEESKYRGERIVRETCFIPHLILRPSIVIGDAYEGKAEGCTFGYYRFAFMLHVFKSWMAENLKKKSLPGRILSALGTRLLPGGTVHAPWLIIPYPKGGVVDMVPIDYVVNTMLALYADYRSFDLKTFHLTQDAPVASIEVLRTCMEDLGIGRITYVEVPHFLFRVILSFFYALLFPLRPYTKSVYWYVPYVTRLYQFDHAHAHFLGLPPAPVITREYLRRVNTYAKEHIFPRIRIPGL